MSMLPNSKSDWPKISIVIPSFNQGRFLSETLESIINQQYPNLELIVIDGGSTDNAVDVIKRFEEHITYWVSEKDRGQSHAINKGVERITGDIFNWINSDDFLISGALKHIAEVFKANPDTHVVAAKSVKFGAVKEEMKVPRNLAHKSFEDFLLNFWIMQPSAFMKTEAFKPLFPLNEKLHFAMDTDLFVRYFLQNGMNLLVISDQSILKFRMHVNSKSVSSQLDFNRERMMIDQKMLEAQGSNLFLKSLSGEDLSILQRYPKNNAINVPHLESFMWNKWKDWENDHSAKYRKVAEYAGWYGDKAMMRKFSWKAIQTSPMKILNWKYLHHAMK